MKKYIAFFYLVSVIVLYSCGNKNRLSIVNTNFTDEISVVQNLYFEFNQEIAPDSVQNTWDSTNYLDIEPEIKGKYMWESPNTLVFSPFEEFLPSTDYEIRLNRNLKKLANRKLRMSKDVLKIHTPLPTKLFFSLSV